MRRPVVCRCCQGGLNPLPVARTLIAPDSRASLNGGNQQGSHINTVGGMGDGVAGGQFRQAGLQQQLIDTVGKNTVDRRAFNPAYTLLPDCL